jgi:hypothetical protein
MMRLFLVAVFFGSALTGHDSLITAIEYLCAGVFLSSVAIMAVGFAAAGVVYLNGEREAGRPWLFHLLIWPGFEGRLRPVTLEIANNRATLVYNRYTHLIFSGPVTQGGAVELPGRNDYGKPGMYLAGVIANGQFDGSTFGLACNAKCT